MRQKLLLLRLVFNLAKMFLVDFYKTSMGEWKSSTLFNQENYRDCTARAKDILETSIERVLKVYALSIAYHREQLHGEDREVEIQELEQGLSPKNIKFASRGFWLR